MDGELENTEVHLVKLKYKTIKCTLCDKSFSRTSNLNKHTREIHKIYVGFRGSKTPLEKKVFCPHCHCGYTTNSNLNKHIRLKHGVNGMAWIDLKEGNVVASVCRFCGTCFSNNLSLNKHLRLQHSSEIQLSPDENVREEIICIYCNHEYSNISNLNKHVRQVHKVDVKKRRVYYQKKINKTRFVCEYCSSSFTRQANLNKHLCVIHGVIIPQTTDLTSSETQPLFLKQYECDICSSVFSRRYFIIRHLSLHGFKLDVCDVGEEIDKVLELLPDNYDYKMDSFKNRGRRSFVASFHFSVNTAEDGKEWLSKFRKKNQMILRKSFCRKSKNSAVVFKAKYHCGYNAQVKNKKKKMAKQRSKSSRNTDCPWALCTVIRNEWRCAKRSQTLGCTMSIDLLQMHNHSHRRTMTFQDVEDSVTAKYVSRFKGGYSPVEAYVAHRNDLKYEYANRYGKVVHYRSHHPPLSWVYRLYYSTLRAQSQRDTNQFDKTNYSTIRAQSHQDTNLYDKNKHPAVEMETVESSKSSDVIEPLTKVDANDDCVVYTISENEKYSELSDDEFDEVEVVEEEEEEEEIEVATQCDVDEQSMLSPPLQSPHAIKSESPTIVEYQDDGQVIACTPKTEWPLISQSQEYENKLDFESADEGAKPSKDECVTYCQRIANKLYKLEDRSRPLVEHQLNNLLYDSKMDDPHDIQEHTYYHVQQPMDMEFYDVD